MSAATNADCTFCRIVRGEIPSSIVYQDTHVIAFRDISPAAPTHILIVPRQHIENAAALDEQTAPLVSHMVMAAKTVAAAEKADKGFRLVFNNGADGGQTVNHLHLHLLAGRPMLWPPG